MPAPTLPPQANAQLQQLIAGGHLPAKVVEHLEAQFPQLLPHWPAGRAR